MNRLDKKGVWLSVIFDRLKKKEKTPYPCGAFSLVSSLSGLSLGLLSLHKAGLFAPHRPRTRLSDLHKEWGKSISSMTKENTERYARDAVLPELQELTLKALKL